MLGNECVKSHHGEIRTPPAGIGSFVSRMTCSSAIQRPPPAESPATTMCSGLTGRCEAPSGGRIRNRSAVPVLQCLMRMYLLAAHKKREGLELRMEKDIVVPNDNS